MMPVVTLKARPMTQRTMSSAPKNQCMWHLLPKGRTAEVARPACLAENRDRARSRQLREIDPLNRVVGHHRQPVVLHLEHHRVAGGVVVHLENSPRHGAARAKVQRDPPQVL